MTRRVALLAAPAALLAPRRAVAGDLAVATFSAGDPRFLQTTFDDIKYAGVKGCEVGKLGSTPAIRVTYDSSRIGYKRVLGAFWRGCDPTRVAQFGEPVPSIVWTVDANEQSIAEESRRRLQLSTEYRSPTFGPMFKGRPVVAEIRPLAGDWEPAPAADQDWYKDENKAYEKAMKKSGRDKFFFDEFKPVTVTACERQGQDGGQAAGTVCGFVYFPCNEENGCSAVTKGTF